MKIIMTILLLVAMPVMGATNLVWWDGTKFFTYANTNSQTNAVSGTNFFFYVSATNWAASWGDYAGYYHGINSNGTVRTITNTWGW